GNRTGMWDATSGGTQIQSISLVQSNGVPTNQISSITTAGTVSYTYDANGNITSDGNHSYSYDGENRLVSVDGGSASYSYDQANRRYKKVLASSSTHYVWERSRVLSEDDGTTGAVQTDYILAGKRTIARVSNGTTSYFLNDRISLRLMLDGSANVVGTQS